jgi:hypothetical protein
MATDGKIIWGDRHDSAKHRTVSPNSYQTYSNGTLHGHSHEVSPPVVSSEVSGIANNIATEIAKEVDKRVSVILEDGGKDEWIAWFQMENENLRQQVQELEIELECMRNAFPEHDNEILPKHRGIF